MKLTPMGDKNCDVYNDDSSQDSIKVIQNNLWKIKNTSNYCRWSKIEMWYIAEIIPEIFLSTST